MLLYKGGGDPKPPKIKDPVAKWHNTWLNSRTTLDGGVNNALHLDRSNLENFPTTVPNTGNALNDFKAYSNTLLDKQAGHTPAASTGVFAEVFGPEALGKNYGVLYKNTKASLDYLRYKNKYGPTEVITPTRFQKTYQPGVDPNLDTMYKTLGEKKLIYLLNRVASTGSTTAQNLV